MNSSNISRKNFLKNSSLILAHLAIGGHTVLANNPMKRSISSTINSEKETPLRLKNVRLETGFIYEDGEVTGTKTALFTITIEAGKIKAIGANQPTLEAIDAEGLLMLPSFKDMHIHLDKTFFGGPWKARDPRNRTVKDMIVYEQKTMPELLKTSTFRAEKMIELLQVNGVSHARSHVNIEPTSKLQSLINVEKAISNKKDSFQAELVAFPQHGIFYSHSEQLMKDVAQLDIDFIGGLDPYSIDGGIERSIDFIVQLALDHQKGIDIHLHENGESGLKTIQYLMKKVEENPVLKEKTFLSHCFVLAKLEERVLQETAEQLSHAKIGIVSTIPFGKTIMPIPTLYKYGVDVSSGNDSIIDHWNTFGSGSMLEKAKLMAQLYGYSTELELSRCLKIATRNILPLDNQGKQQWPQIGDDANMVLVEASCSAEAVSRISPIRSLIHQGRLIY